MKFPLLIKTVFIAFAMMATPAFAGNFQGPYGLAVDPNGSLWVANGSSNNLLVFDHKLASPPKVITGSELNGPSSIAIDTTNIVYVGNVRSTQINAYGLDGARHVEREFSAAPISPSLLVMGPDHVMYASDGINYLVIYDTVNQNSLLQNIALSNSSGQFTTLPITALGSDNGLFFAVDYFGNDNFVSEPSLWAGKQQNSHSYASPRDSIYGLTFDNFHNGFVTSLNKRAVLTLSGNVLISNLPARPFGIALDKTRNHLFVSFTEQNMVQAYTITYDNAHNPIGATLLKTLF